MSRYAPGYTKEWTPKMVRNRAIEIFTQISGAMSMTTIHNRMPSCPREMLATQVNHLVSIGDVLRKGTTSHDYTYQWHRSAEINYIVSQMWKYPEPISPEPRKLSR